MMGSPLITSTDKGATYLFASRENKADFDKNPGKIRTAIWRLLCIQYVKSEFVKRCENRLSPPLRVFPSWTTDKQSWDGGHQVIVHLQPAHSVVWRGIDPHRHGIP